MFDWLIIFKPFAFAHSLGSSAKKKSKNTQNPFHVSFKHLNHTKWFAIIYSGCSVFRSRYSVLGTNKNRSFHPFNSQSMRWLWNPFGLSMQISVFAWKRLNYMLPIGFFGLFEIANRLKWHSRKFLSRKKPHLLWHIFLFHFLCKLWIR